MVIRLAGKRAYLLTTFNFNALMSESNDASSFTYKSPFKYATAVGLQASAVGLVVSTLQNALGNHSHGAMGVVTRTGGTIGLFGAFSLPNLHVNC